MKETYGKCFGCEQWVLGKRASVCDGCAPRSEYGLHCVSLDLTSCLPFECACHYFRRWGEQQK